MRILCYGDSNTWGYVPNINGYSKNAIMQQYSDKDCWWYGLKQNNEVYVNGLCGRCISHENRWLKNRNAMQTIMQDLSIYKKLDLIIVQLGTNDCKTEYGDSPEQIAGNLEVFLAIIEKTINVKIAIISPAIIKENNKITQKFYIGAEDKSKQLDKLYKRIAHKNGYIFIPGFDLEVGEDGEHLTKLAHHKLSKRVLYKIKFLKSMNLLRNESDLNPPSNI